MLQKLLTGLGGFLIGLLVGYGILHISPRFFLPHTITSPSVTTVPRKQVIGFLPYWLLSKAKSDYSHEITTLTYFDLTLDSDGKILKLKTPVEEDPAWYSLRTGKVDPFLESAKKQKLTLSLTVFNGVDESIDQMISSPIEHAQNLTNDVIPLMQQYGFTDLNLDIESLREASEAARVNMTQFIREVKTQITAKKAGTLTVEVSGGDLIHHRLFDMKQLANIADSIVIMAYDFHYSGSYVTGPVAPLGGVATIAEYDIQTAVQQALKNIPPGKIVLGAPLYGYEWETIDNTPRAAVIPGTGITASNQRVEQLLSTCASCSTQLDAQAKEQYLIYQDTDTQTFHQIFFPDIKSMRAKVEFAETNHFGGIALWALGYEGNTILQPLEQYKK